jgi:ubiquinone/menaquinone biosynthesis C-methylase UbiE
MRLSIFTDPSTREQLRLISHPNDPNTITSLRNAEGRDYQIKNEIVDLIYPHDLLGEEKSSQEFYEGRADQYEDTLHLTFRTHGLDETSTRRSFIDRLAIGPGSKVLDIACGTGRDSVLIAECLGSRGELHLQDICADMMRVCHKKLRNHPASASFALANALYLPYPDNYFDAVYSFGALGEFSDISKALKEMVRVAKVGGKIVTGDESMPVWLRNTEYYKILKETNPMFEAPLPLQAIPVEARDTSIHFVIGQAFYLIEFTVGDGEPDADFDFQIPGIRGGTYRSRYCGKLEGVTTETKALAWKAVKESNTNMHEWLDKVVREAARKQFKCDYTQSSGNE